MTDKSRRGPVWHRKLSRLAIGFVSCVVVLLAADQSEAVLGNGKLGAEARYVPSPKNVGIPDESHKIKRLDAHFADDEIDLAWVRFGGSNILSFQRDNPFQIRVAGIDGRGHLVANEPLAKVGQERWRSSAINQSVLDWSAAVWEVYGVLSTKGDYKAGKNSLAQVKEHVGTLKINQSSLGNVGGFPGGMATSAGIPPQGDCGKCQNNRERGDDDGGHRVPPLERRVFLALLSLVALLLLCLSGLHYIDKDRRLLGLALIGCGWLIGSAGFILLCMTGFVLGIPDERDR